MEKDWKLFKKKLYDNNRQYNGVEKFINTITNPFFLFAKLFHDIPGVKRKSRKLYKLLTGKFKQNNSK